MKGYPDYPYVYVYTSALPGEEVAVMYIGKGRERRAWRQKTTSHNARLRLWMRRHIEAGIEPHLEIVRMDSDQSAYEFERELILEFRKSGTLVNILDGGAGFDPTGPKSEEHKAKISATLKGRPQYHSPEHKAALAKANSERIRSAEERQAISRRMMGNKYGLGKTHTYTPTEATRAIWRAQRAGAKHPLFGKPRSLAVKAKISETKAKTRDLRAMAHHGFFTAALGGLG